MLANCSEVSAALVSSKSVKCYTLGVNACYHGRPLSVPLCDQNLVPTIKALCPLLDQYYLFCKKLLIDLISAHIMLCQLLTVLLKTFTTLAVKVSQLCIYT